MNTSWLLALLPAITAATFSYEGYKVFRVILTNYQQAAVLDDLKSDTKYDFFSEISAFKSPIDVMVAPSNQEEFIVRLKSSNIQYSIIDENVESKINAERQRLLKMPTIKTGQINFIQCHRYTVIQAYLQRLATTYSDIVKVEEFGKSFENRSLSLIRIGTESDDKPTILIESTIHAREWIAPVVTTYIIHQLVENTANRVLAENISWIIIPVLNPDGYEYSFTNDRMWRKTRQPSKICYGVDGNRNFDFHWGDRGSKDECMGDYIGPYAFSEPETAAFAQLSSQIKNLVLHLSMHSYGNWILFPWGWTSKRAKNYSELTRLGNAVRKAIAAVHGTRYTVGQISRLLYSAPGNSVDWIVFTSGCSSYAIELPGEGKFIVDPERILPICKEFWPGVETFANYALQKWQNKTSALTINGISCAMLIILIACNTLYIFGTVFY